MTDLRQTHVFSCECSTLLHPFLSGIKPATCVRISFIRQRHIWRLLAACPVSWLSIPDSLCTSPRTVMTVSCCDNRKRLHDRRTSTTLLHFDATTKSHVQPCVVDQLKSYFNESTHMYVTVALVKSNNKVKEKNVPNLFYYYVSDRKKWTGFLHFRYFT